MKYCVYVLYSKKFDKYYCGQTNSLIERFKSHNELSNKGYTVQFRPWHVIYLEHFNNRKEAIQREKQLKSFRGREWVKANFKKDEGFVNDSQREG